MCFVNIHFFSLFAAFLLWAFLRLVDLDFRGGGLFVCGRERVRLGIGVRLG